MYLELDRKEFLSEFHTVENDPEYKSGNIRYHYDRGLLLAQTEVDKANLKRARDGNLTLVGAPSKPMPISSFALLFGRHSLSGSLIGGIAETQEMLEFCGTHNITADVEVIPIQKVNEAYERLLKSDVKYRFSIDMASLKSE